VKVRSSAPGLSRVGGFPPCLRLIPFSALALAAGCATPSPSTLAPQAFPAEALITQRAVLTARGRQFTLNGYLARSETRGLRLLVTENFGNVLADVLVKRDGSVHVMRSSRVFRPPWIRTYIAADLQCVFGDAPAAGCPGRTLSPTHFVIERRWYKLDLHIVAINPGPQPAEMFDETTGRRSGPRGDSRAPETDTEVR